MTKYDISSPAVIVDLDIAERNIERVAVSTRKNGIKHRPHIKAHKSAYFARKQLEAGAIGVAVAKIAEAETMVEHGINDILIAYSIVGAEKLQRLKKLHQTARVMTTVDSLEAAKGLAGIGSPENPLPVLIEIDCGTHRGGRQPGEDTLRFAMQLRDFKPLQIKGIFTYNGSLYHTENTEQLRRLVAQESQLLTEAAENLRQHQIPVEIVSGGSTPALLALEQLHGVTEIRSGNYLFNDVSGIQFGTASVEDCALRVLATVISTPLPGYATIDAGSKTLTNDLSVRGEECGMVVDPPGVQLVDLNEEHGYLRYDPDRVEVHAGDRVEIIPNHACVLPNLCDRIYGVRGDDVVKEITVDARGRNY
ncbi:MAG: alanine racemase [Syntrophaceticus sp.]|jgi:D-serine deaminase-like pyridoxal phosphate-dependent protein|nr:alanine racemase [Syntrophaceticus sp.]MDD3315847.1 alanine racemase [Syntrophaceticus sp.]MDD4359608.1 alanine racemase [Syntrophaceticus sp.]